MIALYKYIRRLIAGGGKELFNEKNMLAEEQMIMNYLSMNKFRLEIRWRILLIKEVGIRKKWKRNGRDKNPKTGLDPLKRGLPKTIACSWRGLDPEAHKVPPLPMLLCSWCQFEGKN